MTPEGEVRGNTHDVSERISWTLRPVVSTRHYTHWHGMYEVGKHFYTEFLPAVVDAVEKKSPQLGEKYKQRVAELLAADEHRWMKGLSPEDAEALRRMYKQRYNQ